MDDSWFRVDLLLFHRRLKCLLVIDLKIGRFSHADAGQMHMYLNYALEGLSNKILAAEYQTAPPDEKLLADELEKTRRELNARRIGRGNEGMQW